MAGDYSPNLSCPICGQTGHTADACPDQNEIKDKQAFVPEELLSESDKIDLIIHYWRNMNPDDAGAYEDVADEHLRKQALSFIKEEWGKRMAEEKFAKIHFLGIKDKNNLVATATAWIPKDVSQPAYLGALTVDDAYRAQGLSKKLQNRVADIVRQAGCKTIGTAVKGKAPVALGAELGVGYRVVGCTDYKRLPEDAADYDRGGWYSLIKDIDPKEKSVGNRDHRRVKLSDYREAKKLIEDKWEGVRLEYVGNGDAKSDKAAENWVLIFEKSK